MTEEAPEIDEAEVVAPADVPEVVAPADVPEVVACVVEIEATSASGGSEGSNSSATLNDDSEESGSEEVVLEAVPAAATPPVAGMVEDDSWYVSFQDFVRWEAEGDAGAPPDFTRAHIPHDEVQASAPCRDVAQAELAVAALAARGQVTTFLIQFQLLFL